MITFTQKQSSQLIAAVNIKEPEKSEHGADRSDPSGNPAEKLTNLKYYLLMAYLSKDIRFLMYLHCMLCVHNSKLQKNSFFFFHDGWIELVELHKKKYVSNLKKVFYESQNFGLTPLIFIPSTVERVI
jgi:hypothetical protein